MMTTEDFSQPSYSSGEALMYTRARSTKRMLCIIEMFLILFLVAVTSLLESISQFANWLIGPVVRLLRIDRIEPWLKERSVWFALPITVLMFALFWGLEIGQYPLYKLGYRLFSNYMLLALGCILLGVIMHIVKYVPLFLVNYFLRLYARKFIEVRWMRFVYRHYRTGKERLFLWLSTKRSYRRFIHYKKVMADKIHLWRARSHIRYLAKKEKAIRFRNLRVIEGKCIGGPS